MKWRFHIVDRKWPSVDELILVWKRETWTTVVLVGVLLAKEISVHDLEELIHTSDCLVKKRIYDFPHTSIW